MRFLADECLHVEIVAALRQAGHEVATVAPADAGASDEAVLERALREHAILLTADKDFGEIAVGRAEAPPGVVLFRRSVADPAGRGGPVSGVDPGARRVLVRPAYGDHTARSTCAGSMRLRSAIE
jgi:hypothetical protein